MLQVILELSFLHGLILVTLDASAISLSLDIVSLVNIAVRLNCFPSASLLMRVF